MAEYFVYMYVSVTMCVQVIKVARGGSAMPVKQQLRVVVNPDVDPRNKVWATRKSSNAVNSSAISLVLSLILMFYSLTI